MCGKPNHGDAEECVHCGARLKPLEVGGSSEDSDDWLERIRDEAGEGASISSSDEIEPDFGFSEGDDEFELDFDQLRAEEQSQAQPGPVEGEVPEWLQRIREKQAEEPQDIPETAPEDALRAAASEAQDKQAEEPQDFPEPAPEDALRAVVSEVPDEQADEQQQFDEPAPEDALRAVVSEIPDEQADEQQQFDEPAPEDALRAAASELHEEQAEGPEPVPVGEAEPAAESPEWLSETDDQGAGSGEDLPHVPALIGGEGDSEDSELGDLGLPDWLGEIEPLEDEPTAEPTGEGPDLAPATLPNWLEAMRPIDTFRSVVEIESEDEQAVESVGPLAGLSGVLLAEPVVAMPRTSSVGSMQLDVSERQYAQAELLHQMVVAEESEAPAKPKRKTRLAIFRWAIAAVVLAAVSLPIITGSPTFALPGLEPRELGALFNLVERLPTEQPVLVVFDYEAGYAGELEAVSGAFLDHLMSRGLLIASMSTRPTGSALAVRAVDPHITRHSYENGQGIVHLGYLSGGPTAVQLFAVNPRAAVLEGFALPDEMQEARQTVWQTPVLDRVQALSDFGMVTVITADSETARVWAEQARPNMGDSKLVVVLSAGAEPLVRPYFESDDPKVGGILSGLPAAAAYELRNGRLGLAQEHWDAFGTAMLAAEFILLAGVGYGVLIWWRGRSPV
jgi:hypothetical protein